MCQALAAYVLGPGIEAFGSGPDGGREATFDGRAQYLSLTDPWDGFVVLQAKFKERLLGTGTGANTAWLRRQVMAELEAWADPGKARVRHGRRPEYMIIATNVPRPGRLAATAPRHTGPEPAAVTGPGSPVLISPALE